MLLIYDDFIISHDMNLKHVMNLNPLGERSPVDVGNCLLNEFVSYLPTKGLYSNLSVTIDLS